MLFSGPMVRAILEGRKTQTRRVVKHIPALGSPDKWCGREHDPQFNAIAGDFRDYAPYPVGTRVWVRETWRTDHANHQTKPSGLPVYEPIYYESTASCTVEPTMGWGVKRPAIFMMRWMSRITLGITDVRVERLQDICEEDAWEEGIHDLAADNEQWYGDPDQGRKTFCLLWESINGPGSWDQNSWVWVYTFKRVEVQA